jgi:hypothetical protein
VAKTYPCTCGCGQIVQVSPSLEKSNRATAKRLGRAPQTSLALIGSVALRLSLLNSPFRVLSHYGEFAGRLKTSTTCSVEGIGVIEINSHRLSPSSMR